MTGWLLIPPTLLGRGHSRGGPAESCSRPPAERNPYTCPPLPGSPSPYLGRHPKAGDRKGGGAKTEGLRACNSLPLECPERDGQGRMPDAGGSAVYDQAGCGCSFTVLEGGWVCQPSRDTQSPGEELPLGPCCPGLSLHMSPLDFQDGNCSLLRVPVRAREAEREGKQPRPFRAGMSGSYPPLTPNTWSQAHPELAAIPPLAQPSGDNKSDQGVSTPLGPLSPV